MSSAFIHAFISDVINRPVINHAHKKKCIPRRTRRLYKLIRNKGLINIIIQVYMYKRENNIITSNRETGSGHTLHIMYSLMDARVFADPQDFGAKLFSKDI